MFCVWALFFISGVLYKIYWVFYPWILVYTDKQGKAVLDESKRLVQGKWWSVFRASISLVFLMFCV